MSERVPGQREEDGVVCPRCECPGTHILIVRRHPRVTQRKRECENLNCRATFWTTERLDSESQAEEQT
jgi:hypothetical protein